MPRPSRMPYAFLAIVLFVVVAGVASYAFLAVGMGLCGGDGGSPYAMPGSPRAAACGVVAPLTPVLALVAVVTTFVGGLISAVEGRGKPVWLAAAWSSAAILAPVVVPAALSQS